MNLSQVVKQITGRLTSIFDQDVQSNRATLFDLVQNSKLLVIGGAGSIGLSFVKEVLKYNPQTIHICDINENALTEVIRDVRSSGIQLQTELKTFPVDFGGPYFPQFYNFNKPYDYIVNFAALKHVRSEKDIYSLLTLLHTNIVKAHSFLEQIEKDQIKKFFSVSTDKAANSVSLMGASKRIMEHLIFAYAEKIKVSSARFPNVAFSNGSLLQGFMERFNKQQPLAGPSDIKRFFVSFEEAGQLCLLSIFLGENLDIFFPKLEDTLDLITFKEVAEIFLDNNGFMPKFTNTEEEAKRDFTVLTENGFYPCYFAPSTTSGEKPFEEFLMPKEDVDLEKFDKIGLIKYKPSVHKEELYQFSNTIKNFTITDPQKDKAKVIEMIHNLVPELSHIERDKFLDSVM